MSQQRKFTIILRPEPEGGFTVRVPMLPEIVTHGDDESHALVMAQEAIELAIEHRLETGEPIPVESPEIREIMITIPAAA